VCCVPYSPYFFTIYKQATKKLMSSHSTKSLCRWVLQRKWKLKLNAEQQSQTDFNFQQMSLLTYSSGLIHVKYWGIHVMCVLFGGKFARTLSCRKWFRWVPGSMSSIYRMMMMIKFLIIWWRFVAMFFFCGGRGLNPGPDIYYAFFLPTERSSRRRFVAMLLT